MVDGAGPCRRLGTSRRDLMYYTLNNGESESLFVKLIS